MKLLSLALSLALLTKSTTLAQSTCTQACALFIAANCPNDESATCCPEDCDPNGNPGNCDSYCVNGGVTGCCFFTAP
ncbi:hypothetical protein BDV96DRAFT_591174 [Lophiotrema nucula]|uniref:Uncharacterized protein n=1 Tax=Lophiotrema nucula TaxID=690887 RepID=A0A6A5YG74_9PLEO|nr:hypothetical protein BDV96DRAFT_591174 [Lophiotrema nucula]